MLFLISGRAKIVIEGEGEWEIGPETAFYSPLGKKHRVENIGDEPLRIVWVYCPPLPAHHGLIQQYSIHTEEKSSCLKQHANT